MNQRVAREVLGEGHLKGGIFRSHLRWVQDHRTEADVRRLWARLPPDISKALSGVILIGSWYPFGWLVELDRAIVELFGEGRSDILRELGRYSARLNLSTTYRAFNRENNHEFFRNSAVLHSQFQDFGTASYEQLGEASGRMVHRGYLCFSPVYCASALGYYEECVATHGGEDVLVTETECHCYGDQSCTFEMRWE